MGFQVSNNDFDWQQNVVYNYNVYEKKSEILVKYEEVTKMKLLDIQQSVLNQCLNSLLKIYE